VTEHDVHLTLGLLTGPLEVVELENEITATVEFRSLLNSWKRQWPKDDNIPKCGELIEMIQGQVDGCEDFRRNFIMFVVSTCLCGNQSGEANYMILNALVDLSQMTQLNWAQYTLRSLLSSVN